MTPEQRDRLDKARIRWKAAQSYLETCGHALRSGSGTMLFENDDGEIWHNTQRCNSCGASWQEVKLYRNDGDIVVLATDRTR